MACEAAGIRNAVRIILFAFQQGLGAVGLSARLQAGVKINDELLAGRGDNKGKGANCALVYLEDAGGYRLREQGGNLASAYRTGIVANFGIAKKNV